MSGPVQSVRSGPRFHRSRTIPASAWPSPAAVTTANIMPGSGNVIGGQTLYVKLRGHTIEEMRILGKRDGRKFSAA